MRCVARRARRLLRTRRNSVATVLAPKEATIVTDTATTVESPSSSGAHRSQTRRGWRDMRTTLLVVGALLSACIAAVVFAYAVKGSSAPAGDIQATTVDYEITMPT